MTERSYLPTFAELVDRLSIVQLKAVFIPEHAAEYRAEMELILHDLDILRPEIDARSIHAMLVLMLCNRYIWENEAKARAGGAEQDKLLKLTHSINGVRNTAKNVLSSICGDRKDFKADALAAELHEEFGNWNVFGPREVAALVSDPTAKLTVTETGGGTGYTSGPRNKPRPI
jgi:hypothetical protein